MVTYKVVFAINTIDLGVLVTKMMNDGWVPQGGICIDTSGNFLQSMIKYKTFHQKEYQYNDNWPINWDNGYNKKYDEFVN